MGLTETNKQILIVEDERIIAADIQSRLERLGYSVPAIAQSGEEALRFARGSQFDLVLMDIRLKGEMDGVATAQAMKSELETPVVYITAHADEETIKRAAATEPFGYILKPIRDSELRSAVQISIHKHEMERRVRASEAWLSATLRSIGEGVIATDIQGQVVFMNPVAEQLTGWQAAEADGRKLMDVLALQDESTGEPAADPIFGVSSRPHSYAGTANRAYVLTSRGGATATVELTCFPNRDAVLLGAILVLRDIGGRRELERRVMQSQRMEAIANLASGLAHDFNNQLTVILGCADELCESLTAAHRERATEIKHAGSLAASLTSQLLTLSRHQAMRPEALSFNDLAVEMQPSLSCALGKTRELSTHLDPALGRVRADRNQYKQVLLNLALNARDAMPDGGELRLETSNIDIAPESPKAEVFPPGPYVRLLVSDRGQGMDPKTLARIFEPFFTTKKPGFGTGLGLSMVHSIVMQSGGYITARSEPGLGTAFEILLPRLAASKPANGPGSTAAATVLLVDDQAHVRRAMHRHFAAEGYRLLEAGNGAEAESIAASFAGPIDVMVTDVAMPDMSGPQLAGRLAPLRPDMQVLFISGQPPELVLRDADAGGSPHFLRKPFSGPDLLSRVRSLLAAAAHA